MIRKNASKIQANEDPLTMQEVCAMIIARYAPGVFLEQNMRKRLLSGGVRMNPKKNVAHYYIEFTNAVEKAQVMLDEPTLAVLFLQGLTDPLQLRCQVGTNKKPFESLQDLYEHAIGVELEVKALKDTLGVRVNVMRQGKRSSEGQRGGPGPKRMKNNDHQGHKMTVEDHMTKLFKQFDKCKSPDDPTTYQNASGKYLTVRELAVLRVEGKCTHCEQQGHIRKDCKEFKAGRAKNRG